MSSQDYPERQLWQDELAYKCPECDHVDTRIFSNRYSVKSGHLPDTILEYCEECDFDGEFPIIECGGDNPNSIRWNESKEHWQEFLDEETRNSVLATRGYTLEEIENNEFETLPPVKESKKEERMERLRMLRQGSQNDSK